MKKRTLAVCLALLPTVAGAQTRSTGSGGAAQPKAPAGQAGRGGPLDIYSVVLNPSAGQKIVQPVGTTLAIDNLNQTFTVNGNGSTDNTSQVQAAINACVSGSACNINLANVVIAGTVTIPVTSDFVFIGTGSLSCTGVGAKCFYRSLSSGTSTHRVRFTGFQFAKANAGAVIADIQHFSSAGNQGMTIDHNNFILSKGAIGFMVEGSSFNNIDTNYFSSPFTLNPANPHEDRTGTAIQPQSVTSAYGPMVGTVSNNSFNYLRSVNPVNSSTTQSQWEGWTFIGNHFSQAPADFLRGNEVNLLNNEFSGSPSLFSGSNSIISGNYFDVGITAGFNVLTVWNAVHLNITNNTFVVGSANSNGIVFTNHDKPGTPSETTNVIMEGNFLLGYTYKNVGAGSAMVFADSGARNLYVSGNNFRDWFTAFDLRSMLDRSTFGNFEAREVAHYGRGFGINAGPSLRSPNLYSKVHVHAAGSLDSTLVGRGVFFADTFVASPDMLPGVQTNMTADHCDTGVTASLTSSQQGALYVRLAAGASTPAGLNTCDVTIVFDGQNSIAPR